MHKYLVVLFLFSGFISHLQGASDITSYPSSHLPKDESFQTSDFSSDSNKEKKEFYYFRFTASQENLSKPISSEEFSPGLGFGYRKLTGGGAIDVSINFQGHEEEEKIKRVWSAPKVVFTRYIKPELQENFYVGCGLALGGVIKEKWPEEFEKFAGLIPSVVAGYEFLKKNSALGFIEAEVSRPSIPIVRGGDLPGIFAQLSLGAGF